jgi:hypothetical protein
MRTGAVGSWSHQHDIKAIQQAIQQVIPETRVPVACRAHATFT